ncbi:universal stress protein, UspA [Exilibacterium tricleocarpae]|uniref:Universal stress protein, UspA n=1 Tax=Exilibacterium tricleocarpae TaxID=2591008 RepID=A0A545TAJ4_9GAMM|nr:universal stress protein [Exilibacterium tricleocarpae]TQV74227.1 universal stress protein, UspA [Exilibacterium tricleocarpae]
MRRFKNILCALSPDADNGTALQRAAALAASNQAQLRVVMVADEIEPDLELPTGAPTLADLRTHFLAAQQQALDSQVARLGENLDVHTRVLMGPAFLEIIRAVLRDQCDLVIKAPVSGGLLDRVFGSDDMHLLRKCPCPVWLVKPQVGRAYQRIVAPVDVDEFYDEDELNTRHQLNVQILEMASSLALSEFASLHIVAVWRARYESAMQGGFMNMPEEKVGAYVNQVKQQYSDNLDRLLAEVTGSVGQALEYIKPQIHVIKGWPREEIPAFTKSIEADLVVMGTLARSGIPGFLMGNTAETILNRLNCSVLAVKPEGFVSPVTLS